MLNKFPEANSHWFMQENDPKHCSHTTQKFYDVISINWWHTPLESLDINSIKDLWHDLIEFLWREIKLRIKQQLVDCRNGKRFLWRISQYSGASILPTKIQMPVGPFLLILAHTCILTEYFSQGFRQRFLPSFLQQNLRWVSNWITDSSFQITFSKVSWRLACAHSNHFYLLTFLISWQYAEPPQTHLNLFPFQRIVVNDT